jgi:hypothetical protein
MVEFIRALFTSNRKGEGGFLQGDDAGIAAEFP